MSDERDSAYAGQRRAICVVGLGKIGLPLAVQCARASGDLVIGCDIDARTVAAINDGQVELREEGLAEALHEVVRRGTLRATTDTAAAVRQARVVVVIVPVGLTDANEVDFGAIDAAALAVGDGLQPGTLVVFESTVPVGTTRERLGRLLSSVSNLEPGKHFSLAFSPERVYSGRIFRDLATYPKVVGGFDIESTARAGAFYREVLDADVLTLSSTEAAEYTKLVETTYRDVNIALANEFALFAQQHGIDVQEAIRAANTQPFSHIHQPSVGVGGHCIPVYPYFLFARWDGFRIPPMARAINDGMAAHGVELLETALGTVRERRILLLGLTYRENVKETAYSSARRISRELRHRGAIVLGYDPFLTDAEQLSLKVQPVRLHPAPEVDAIVLQAYHDQFKEIDWGSFPGLQALLDGRGALTIEQSRQLRESGIRYLRIGLSDAAEVER
jgi:nucleotide sugar dehydrogenase